jgi:hypothetical protein
MLKRISHGMRKIDKVSNIHEIRFLEWMTYDNLSIISPCIRERMIKRENYEDFTHVQ